MTSAKFERVSLSVIFGTGFGQSFGIVTYVLLVYKIRTVSASCDTRAQVRKSHLPGS